MARLRAVQSEIGSRQAVISSRTAASGSATVPGRGATDRREVVHIGLSRQNYRNRLKMVFDFARALFRSGQEVNQMMKVVGEKGTTTEENS